MSLRQRHSDTLFDLIVGLAAVAALSALLMSLLTGCAYTRIDSGSASARRWSVGTDLTARGFEASLSTGGVFTVRWQSGGNVETKAAGAITKGAIEGAGKALK